MLNREKINIFILLLISLPLSLIFLINNPIEFQCDSALFYNYASGINFYLKKKFLIFFILGLGVVTCIFFIKRKYNFDSKNYILFSLIGIITFTAILSYFYQNTPFQIIDLKRPPIYPIFLFLSGIFLTENLFTLILLQNLLSIICIIFIYKLIFLFTKSYNLSLLFTILFSLTSIPYILIKFIIAEQLLFFLTIATIFFLSKFHFKKKYKYLNISLILATLAWLTKWEGQLLFISVLIYFFLNHSIFKSSNLKQLIIILFIPTIILTSWVTIRSISVKDFSKILSVSNSNFEQFFYKFYSVLPSELYVLKGKLGIENKNNIIENFIFDNQKQILVIRVDNGDKSKALYEAVLNSILKNPNSYMSYKEALANAYSYSENKIDLYQEIFGKFNFNPVKITMNIFNQPNIYYFNYINTILDQSIGKVKKDILFKGAILEALRNEPYILIGFIFDYLTSFGINLEEFFNNGSFPIGSGFSNVIFINPFDAGKCGTNNLSTYHFHQYEKSHQNWNKYPQLENITILLDKINDFIRDYFGFLFFISSFFLMIFINYKIFLPLSFFPFMYDLLVAITVDGNMNSKYEVITFSIKYIILVIFFITVFQLIANKIYAKKE